MKILIITQKIDMGDDVLGFMHGWISEFAKQADQITAIGLYCGRYDFPPNVKVLSLGKEKRFTRIKYIWNFYKYIWGERNNYDAVFVHMNQVYVNMGGLIWRIMGKKVSLWYAHGHVPFGLRLAEKLTHIIFTSTKSGCRVKSKKIIVVGQGIDTLKFIGPLSARVGREIFRIVSVGRISASKNYETLVEAVRLLRERGIKVIVEIVGKPVDASGVRYFAKLKKFILDTKLAEDIVFRGAVSNNEVVSVLQNSDLFVNMGLTGSLDKAIPEAMSTELPILTCNEALTEVLGPYCEYLMYPKRDSKALADKIEMIYKLLPDERAELGRKMREIVVRGHNLPEFTGKIIKFLSI